MGQEEQTAPGELTSSFSREQLGLSAEQASPAGQEMHGTTGVCQTTCETEVARRAAEDAAGRQAHPVTIAAAHADAA
ncbi:hypothetical protein NQZ68_005081 [Dissostichus eleginoides]|nr:hypothetical protein NQZ68_005081 [Dissostichus eleginoides]